MLRLVRPKQARQIAQIGWLAGWLEAADVLTLVMKHAAAHDLDKMLQWVN